MNSRKLKIEDWVTAASQTLFLCKTGKEDLQGHGQDRLRRAEFMIRVDVVSSRLVTWGTNDSPSTSARLCT